MPLKNIPNKPNKEKEHSIRLSRAYESRPQLIARVGWRTVSYGILDNSKENPVATQDLPSATSEWAAYGTDLNTWPCGHPISMPGDSGSWIINSEGDLIAMLWGGETAVDVCYVTPIEEVIKDIEEQTDCIVVLPGGVNPLAYGDRDLPMTYHCA